MPSTSQCNGHVLAREMEREHFDSDPSDCLSPNDNDDYVVVEENSEDSASSKMADTDSFWSDKDKMKPFQRFRPTTVLTNLQRGNTKAEPAILEPIDTSLHHRAGQGELSFADLENETNVNAKDAYGITALMWASAYGQLPTARLLMENGASVNMAGRTGETALMLASSGGHHEVVAALIAAGADVNQIDEIGNTALMYAAFCNRPHCVNELLVAKADLSIANENEDTAFSLAVARGSKLALSVIANHLLDRISHGGDISINDLPEDLSLSQLGAHFNA